MSDEPVKAARAAPSGTKTSKAVLALLLFNLGASGFATFKLVTAKPAAAATAHEQAKPGPTSTEVTGPVVSLQPLVEHETGAIMEKNKRVIRDGILSHLSGLELADTLGTAAKDKLRADVMKKLEQIVGEHEVRRMLFQASVVQ